MNEVVIEMLHRELVAVLRGLPEKWSAAANNDIEMVLRSLTPNGREQMEFMVDRCAMIASQIRTDYVDRLGLKKRQRDGFWNCMYSFDETENRGTVTFSIPVSDEEYYRIRIWRMTEGGSFTVHFSRLDGSRWFAGIAAHMCYVMNCQHRLVCVEGYAPVEVREWNVACALMVAWEIGDVRHIGDVWDMMQDRAFLRTR